MTTSDRRWQQIPAAYRRKILPRSRDSGALRFSDEVVASRDSCQCTVSSVLHSAHARMRRVDSKW